MKRGSAVDPAVIATEPAGTGHRVSGQGTMRILAYTPPSRGHLTPMMGPLLELRRRGAEVHVRTLAAAVDAVRAAGLEAAPISPAIEELALDDHKANSQITAGARTFATLRNRAGHEVADLEEALDSVAPNVVLSRSRKRLPQPAREQPLPVACAPTLEQPPMAATPLWRRS